MDMNKQVSIEAASVEKNGLKRLLKVVEEFRKLDPEMPAQTIVVLLRVMITERLSHKEVIEAMGSNSASISRNVAALSESRGFGKPGSNVVKSFENPMDRRSKLLQLTSKGEKVRDTLIDLMSS